jgi:hypothetical protein
MAALARQNDDPICRRRRRFVVAATVALATSTLVVGGCAGGHTGAASAPAGTQHSAPVPRSIAARPAGGSAGVAPVVAPSGVPSVALPDRTLTVTQAASQPAGNSVSIRVGVAIANSGARAIVNDSSAFRLIGPEGDIFGAVSDSSASLDGVIAAHATRTGTMTFQVPIAAASGLQLLYRSGSASRAAMIPLNLR